MSKYYKADDVEREIERLLRFRTKNDFDLGIKHGIETVERVLKDLPTIEVDEDTISRQWLLDSFGLSEKTRKYGGDHSGYDTLMLYEIQNVIEDAPSVIPEPKESEWEELGQNKEKTHNIRCKACGAAFKSKGHANSLYTRERFRFCSNCGTKMKGEK